MNTVFKKDHLRLKYKNVIFEVITGARNRCLSRFPILIEVSLSGSLTFLNQLKSYYFVIPIVVAIGWLKNLNGASWIHFKCFQHRQTGRLKTKSNFSYQPIATVVKFRPCLLIHHYSANWHRRPSPAAAKTKIIFVQYLDTSIPLI